MREYTPVPSTAAVSSTHARRRRFIWLAACFFFLLLLLVSFKDHISTSSLLYDGYSSDKSGEEEVLPQSTLRHTHIAIASYFGSHYDVHLPLAKSIRDVLGPENAHVQVFAFAPFRYGFSDIVESLHLYNGTIQSPRDLIPAIASGSPFEDDPGHPLDLLVLGTCEVDMNQWSDQLLAAWDARPADQKFKLVCIVHNVRDTKWQIHIPPWASRGALRLLPIGDQVARAFRTELREIADKPDPRSYTALLEFVDIDVHVPVLDLPEYGTRSTSPKVSRAAIQGSFQRARRDYANVFRDLVAELEYDAPAWGYRPLTYDRSVFEPLPDADEDQDERFQLFLLGYGELEIPKSLANVVVVKSGLDYSEYYSLMQSMDIVIPAFSDDSYYEWQASSTVAMAVECNIPILATKRIREAYGYIDDDRVVITRPQALREIAAIRVLRSGSYAPPRNASAGEIYTDSSIYKDRFLAAVDGMLLRGWRRPLREYDEFKRELWAKNRMAVRRILTDSPGSI